MRYAIGNLWEYWENGFSIVIPTNIGWKANGDNVMGAGLAREAAERFPRIVGIYGLYCWRFRGRAGVTAIDWEKRITDKKLFMFPVKPLNNKPWESWKGKADLLLIKRSTIQLQNLVERMGQMAVALPLVGCGNGELTRCQVLPILDANLDSRFVLTERDRRDFGI